MIDKMIDIGKVFPGEKAYDDLLHPVAKELGSMFGNTIKVIRLVGFFPVDYLATLGNKYQNWLKRIETKIPEENLIDYPLPTILLKSFEEMRYIEEDDILAEMFLNLIASSLDKERVEFAHPAFSNILSQLSRDEAIIIYLLSQQKYEMEDYSKYDASIDLFTSNEITKNSFPLNKLSYSDNFFIYMDHLHSLNLAEVRQFGRQFPDIQCGKQVGVFKKSIIELTKFGQLFGKACIMGDMSQYENLIEKVAI